LLFQILKQLYQKAGLWSSYNLWSGCWESSFASDELAYPEELEVDEMIIEDGRPVLYKGPLRIREIPDLDLYRDKAKLVLSHEEPGHEYLEFFGATRKWIYLMRDGRAAVNSLLHFLVTPVLLKRHPDYRIDRVEELYQLPGYFERHVSMWRSHVEAFMKLRRHYLLLRYEDLIGQKAELVGRIADFVGLSEPDVDSVLRETSFESMKKAAPVHVRKGDRNDWESYFTGHHRKRFSELAGDLLIEFGYEEDASWI
jgi:hypothetical protein